MALDALFSWYIEKRIARITKFTNEAESCQAKVLHDLISQAQNTSFGNTYHFSEIKDYSSFKTKVPLGDYNSLKKYIELAKEGTSDVLWPGKSIWFAKSSGTTGERMKVLPVTKDALHNNHHAGGKDILALYYKNYPSRKLYSKKHLVIGGSGEIQLINQDIFVGDLSAIIVKNLPWWTEYRRTPAVEIALIADWEEKLERMAQTTLNENVALIVGVPSWTLLLIKRILKITGADNIHEVWPNLELYIHGGMNISPYLEEFNKISAPGKLNFMESYNASEGCFGLQDQKDHRDLLLLTDAEVFYEFIPMEFFDGINSTVIMDINSVEINTEYALVISTSSGLWRYIIGDTIRFTSTAPYRFVVSGRTTQYVNAFGEKMIVKQTEEAIALACKACNAHITDFTVGPYFNSTKSNGGHEWMIEFEQEPKDLSHFEEEVDRILKALNSDYETKRFGNINIDFPKFNYLKPKSFEAWLKKKGKLGGQHKVPRLMNDRSIIEDLISAKE